MNIIRIADSPLLFAIFRANAFFSGACGIALLTLADPLAAWSGFSAATAASAGPAWVLGSVGAGLCMFALRLCVLVLRGSVDFREAAAIATADIAWVLGTVILIVFAGEALSTGGLWLLVVTGLVVLMFGETQAALLWRHRSRVTTCRR